MVENKNVAYSRNEARKNMQAIERKSDWTKKNIASNPTNIVVKRGLLTYQESTALSWTMR